MSNPSNRILKELGLLDESRTIEEVFADIITIIKMEMSRTNTKEHYGRYFNRGMYRALQIIEEEINR